MKCLKKYLLLFVACFCFLSCKNVFAEELKFTSTDLDSEETYIKIINYMKSKYNFNNFMIAIDYNKAFIDFYTLDDGYTANVYDFQSLPFITYSRVEDSPIKSPKIDGCILYRLLIDTVYDSNSSISQNNPGGSFESQVKDNLIKYSSFDLKHYNGTTIFAKNYDFNKDDNTTDKPPVPDKPTDTDNPSDYYHPTKEEYMLTPFFLALIVMMLFLKWCFPLKGGKKL